tara:strand:+ start:8141 stop:9019 length:879 start_codon:yes stop_codon:yes gene_type:complete
MIDYRWMALFDSHGDQADGGAVEAAFEFAKHFKPDRRIAGGDHWDFRWLRRGASDDEKREGVLADLDAGCEFLKRWNPADRLLGNHDWRLNRALHETNSEGPIRELARMMADQISDRLPPHNVITYCKRNGILTLGDHSVLHGYSAGQNMTRQHANVYGPCIIGHGHAIEVQTSGRDDQATGYQSGCLCYLDMDYNRHQLGSLRHQHGFAYGVVTKAGKCIVWLAREEDDGSWILPSELTALQSTRNLSQPSSDSPPPTTTSAPQGLSRPPSFELLRGGVETVYSSGYEMPR